MPVTTKNLGYTDRFRFNRPTVWAKSTWGNAWASQPNTVAMSASRVAGRGISRAVLVHDYGPIKNAGSTTFATINPSAILDSWVMIEWTPESGITGADPFTPNDRWFGIATDEQTQEMDSVGGIACGRQTFTCHGLEWPLTRKQITSSYVLKTAGTASVKVDFGIPFNGGRGRAYDPVELLGNQANVLDSNGKKTFDDKLSNPRAWNAREIVEYLLHFHNPYSSGLTMALGGDAVNDLASYQPAEVVVHGRTLFDILNQVIDFRRGLMWHLEMNETSSIVTVKVSSIASASASIAGTSFSLSANGAQINLQLTDPHVVRSLVRTRSTQRQYDRVIAEGAPIGYVYTERCGGGVLMPTWSSSDLSAYAAAASGTSGYSSLDRDDKKNRNDSLRVNDRTLANVFTSFTFVDADVIDVQLDDAAEVTGTKATWGAGWRVENYLPLRAGWDYSTTPPTQGPAGSAAEFLRPFAFAKVDGKTWVDLSKTHVVAMSERLGGGLQFSVNVAPSDQGVGVVLEVSGPSHLIASASKDGHSAGTDVFDATTAAPSNASPQISWSDIFSTVYITSPQPIRAAWPSPAGSARHNMVSELLLRFGDRAHYDYCRSTVTYAVAGSVDKQVAVGNTVLRDDRLFLRSISLAAWQWYATPRKSVEVVVKTLTSLVRLGDLVTQVNATTGVNSIVTHVAWNFSDFSTTIETDFAELDFLSIGGAS